MRNFYIKLLARIRHDTMVEKENAEYLLRLSALLAEVPAAEQDAAAEKEEEEKHEDKAEASDLEEEGEIRQAVAATETITTKGMIET